MPFENAPIPRHKALKPLSRDHYVGLVHAQRLKKAASKDRVARHKALADFLDAWRTEIEPHFRDEERLLTPLIAGENDRRRLLHEHAAIERAAKEAVIKRRAVDPDPDFVKRLGQDIEQHIRWEERMLFNQIQESASERQLHELTVATEEVERARNRGRGGCKTGHGVPTDTDANNDRA